MKQRLRQVPVPYAILLVLFIIVAAWAWSWPDHPLIPDEAFAKEMTDSFAANRTPFAQEDFTRYRDGTFGIDRYGGTYSNNTIVVPATSVAVPIEQGVVGVKLGRAATLALGVAAIAYLGARLGGSWAGLFAGALYLTHPATLYFHQSYFSNSGGIAYFLVSLALLEGSRTRWWLAPFSAIALAVATVFRVEYALAGLVIVPLAGTLGPVRGWRGRLAYYATVGGLFGLLWNIQKLAPGLDSLRLLTESLDLKEMVRHPIVQIRSTLDRYQGQDVPFAVDVVQGNLWDSFAFMFPFTSVLALIGLFVRHRDRAAAWVYIPFVAQSGLQAYAILPALEYFDFSGVSWLESSIVRYFLVTYALCALLGGVALAAAVTRLPVEALRFRGVTWQRLGAVVVTILVSSTAVVHAKDADHGVDWANQRRAWFDEIDEAAEAFGPSAIFVGKTPGKIVFTRPLLNPENVGWDPDYTVDVLADLMRQGHRVFAFEPWYFEDHGHSIEAILLNRGKTYWTDTGVVIDCPCGEFARFYELHLTNATFSGVARLNPGTFAENATGMTTDGSLFSFFSERAAHIRMGLGQAGVVDVSIRYLDVGSHNVTLGYWNLPVENKRNEHAQLNITLGDSGVWKTATFSLPAGEIVNGPFYIRGALHFDLLEVRAS